MPDAYILGIESSCDETGASVVRSGEQILSNVVFSQIATHLALWRRRSGVGVARAPARLSFPSFARLWPMPDALTQSLDAIAVTQGPGLAGALLVGLSYAKALAFALEKPLIAVNHLEGHIHAVLLEERQKGNHLVNFPVLALVVSGGHTHLYLAEQKDESWFYENMGHTRDDAAGEAFDKVAKLLGLGYPGRSGHRPPVEARGPHSREVRQPADQASRSQRPWCCGRRPSALRLLLQRDQNGGPALHRDEQSRPCNCERGAKLLSAVAKPKFEDYLAACESATVNLVASFQRAMVDDLVAKTLEAAQACEVATLFVTGGVAANNELRLRFEESAAQQGLPVFFPSRPLSTDNAAMIAAAAYPKWLAKDFAPMDFSAEAGLQLRRA